MVYIITVSAGLIQQEEENFPSQNGALKVNGDPTWGISQGRWDRPHTLCLALFSFSPLSGGSSLSPVFLSGFSTSRQEEIHSPGQCGGCLDFSRGFANSMIPILDESHPGNPGGEPQAACFLRDWRLGWEPARILWPPRHGGNDPWKSVSVPVLVTL